MIGNKFTQRINKYKADYEEYGYDPRAMAMPSDRRTIRYEELIKNFTFYKNKDEKFSLLDAGCGFGDLASYLDFIGCRNYQYIGIDVVDEFLEVAMRKYFSKSNISFDKFNIYEDELSRFEYDYAVTSQVFNDRYSDKENNMDIVVDSIGRLFQYAKKGVSFNFVTDRVQYKRGGWRIIIRWIFWSLHTHYQIVSSWIMDVCHMNVHAQFLKTKQQIA